MHSDQSGAFCFMGVSSKPAIFVSEKDPKRNPDSGSPVTETECRNSIEEDLHLARLKQQECDDMREEDQRKYYDQDTVIRVRTVLELAKKLDTETEASSHDDGSEANGEGDDCNDGFITPTSADHKIPEILQCPGAPRKTKTEAPPAKRKAAPSCRRRIDFDPFDEDVEMKSLFPVAPFVVDLDGGDSSKKVKRVAGTNE